MQSPASELLRKLTAFLAWSLIFFGCSLMNLENPEPALPPADLPTSAGPITDWWHPEPGLSWQWQLDGKIDLEVEAEVYDLDYETELEIISDLKAQGVKLICYISLGSYEDWREDADRFPDEVLGNEYEGWPGERWLDIRRIDLLGPIMEARLDICAQKGFDAVEPDNIEIYTNNTGFPLTYEDQLNYALWLAGQAHARGLSIGLKNAPDQAADLVEDYDFAITEDCFSYQWCEGMLPFIEANKAVFAAEYTDMDVDFEMACIQADELGISVILKRRSLSAWVEFCP
jgi:hypothetical protein